MSLVQKKVVKTKETEVKSLKWSLAIHTTFRDDPDNWLMMKRLGSATATLFGLLSLVVIQKPSLDVPDSLAYPSCKM